MSTIFGAACAADNGEAVAALRAALQGGADIDESLPDGRTPLMLAAMYGRTAQLEFLLNAGAATHKTDCMRRTATAWAAVMSQLAALKLLLEHGGTAPSDDEAAAVLCARNGNARALRLLVNTGTDPSPLFASSRRSAVALVTALDAEELCRSVVMNARLTHPLVSCLVGSAQLKRMHSKEISRDAATAEMLMLASVHLERVACGLVQTGESHGALLSAKLCPDGRTAVELAVDERRKQFIAKPLVQEHIDSLFFHSSVLYHVSRKGTSALRPLRHLVFGVLFIFVSPLLLFASYMRSSLAIDLQVAFSPLERYVAKEMLFIVWLILAQFLERVPDEQHTIPWREGGLGLWLFAIWLGELQHWLASRRAEKGRKPLVAELVDIATDGWRGLDVMAFSLAMSAAAVRIATFRYHELGVYELQIRSAAYLILWLRLAHVLSVFSFTGPLVRMVLSMIAKDMTRWAFLQVLVLIAFASALSALYGGLEPDPDVIGSESARIAFGTIGQSMKSLTELLLNVGDPYPGDGIWMLVHESGLGWALMAGFALLTTLLLMNLLIALLNFTCDAIRNHSQVEFMWGRAQAALDARTLPVLPPPLNLVHMCCQAIGWAIAPALQRFGVLPAEAVQKLEGSTSGSYVADAADAVVLAATDAVFAATDAVVTTGRVCWGVLAGEAPVAPQKRPWVHPGRDELKLQFEDAWQDAMDEHAEEEGEQAKQLHNELLARHAEHAERASTLTNHLMDLRAELAELRASLVGSKDAPPS